MSAAVPQPDPERQLLARAVQGDRDALAAVARAWRPRIRRWALLELGDASLAEDASQEVLVRLIRHIHRYDPARPFGPWLRAIVRNCSHRTRSRFRRSGQTEVQEGHLRVVPTPEQRIDDTRAVAAAIRSFQKLSARQREVFHLCTHGGLSAAEAARELGIAPSTARVLLFRARRTLRASLAQEAP